MKVSDLKNYPFINAELEALEETKKLYYRLLPLVPERREKLLNTIDRQIMTLKDYQTQIRTELEAIQDPEIIAIIENRYLRRRSWEDTYKKVYAGAHSKSPEQYCKRKIDRYLKKREEKKMKKTPMDITETFFSEENGADLNEPQPPKKEEGSKPTGRKTADKRLKVVKEQKSTRLQLLIRPSTKAALKAISEATGQSINDIANELFERYIDQEETKAERKGK